MQSLIFPYLHTLFVRHEELFALEKLFSPHEILERIHNRESIAIWSPEKNAQIFKKSQEYSFEKFCHEFSLSGAKIALYSDGEYPGLLHHIKQQPFYISYLGAPPKEQPLLGMVGSRKHTEYGASIVELFTPALIEAGFGIVSGGAIGIDALAHEQTLSSEGYTLAIVGTGIDIVYPTSNTRLYKNIIASGGGIVSVFPFGTKPVPYNFPIRNAIIAALSDGVFVVEAKEKSGSLITARLALEFGKDVFIPPADIFRTSSLGTNMFLKSGGAKVVVTPDDILEEYGSSRKNTFQMMLQISDKIQPKKLPDFSSSLEKDVYNLLVQKPQSPDDIAEKLQISIEEILTLLSFLEISGYITSDISGKYCIYSGKK